MSFVEYELCSFQETLETKASFLSAAGHIFVYISAVKVSDLEFGQLYTQRRS